MDLQEQIAKLPVFAKEIFAKTSMLASKEELSAMVNELLVNTRLNEWGYGKLREALAYNEGLTEGRIDVSARLGEDLFLEGIEIEDGRIIYDISSPDGDGSYKHSYYKAGEIAKLATERQNGRSLNADYSNSPIAEFGHAFLEATQSRGLKIGYEPAFSKKFLEPAQQEEKKKETELETWQRDIFAAAEAEKPNVNNPSTARVQREEKKTFVERERDKSGGHKRNWRGVLQPTIGPDPERIRKLIEERDKNLNERRQQARDRGSRR